MQQSDTDANTGFLLHHFITLSSICSTFARFRRRARRGDKDTLEEAQKEAGGKEGSRRHISSQERGNEDETDAVFSSGPQPQQLIGPDSGLNSCSGQAFGLVQD